MAPVIDEVGPIDPAVTIDLSVVGSILKKVYLPQVKDDLFKSSVLLQRLEQPGGTMPFTTRVGERVIPVCPLCRVEMLIPPVNTIYDRIDEKRSDEALGEWACPKCEFTISPQYLARFIGTTRRFSRSVRERIRDYMPPVTAAIATPIIPQDTTTRKITFEGVHDGEDDAVGEGRAGAEVGGDEPRAEWTAAEWQAWAERWRAAGQRAAPR